MRRQFIVILLGVLSFFSYHCGYSTHTTLPRHFRTIHIEPFKNAVGYSTEGARRNLYVPLLEVKTRSAIADRFLLDGTLKVIEPQTADLILKGELKDYDRAGLRFSDSDDVEEYRISITVSLELFDTSKQETVWAEPSFSGEATYFLSGPQATSEEAAIQKAMEDLARRVVERTVEDW